MDYIVSTLSNLWNQTAFVSMTPGNYVMVAVALLFLYLAIRWDFEPLLLVPIAFGMLLVNIYPDIMLSLLLLFQQLLQHMKELPEQMDSRSDQLEK